MPRLQLGDSGLLVERWNEFLAARRLPHGEQDFDDETEKGTREFQALVNKRAGAAILTVDGIAGNMTLGCGISFDLNDNFDAPLVAKLWGYPYPVMGDDVKPSLTEEQMHALFGRIEASPARDPDNPERVVITNGWEEENIEAVAIPQLMGIAGGRDEIPFHKKLKRQLTALWQAWEQAGLLPDVKSFDGSFSRRYKRGTRELSNHCWATAFDINYSANKLRAMPATPDEVGCVYRLVSIAHKFGGFWGGHFRSRLDGMHFEFTRIMSAEEIDIATRQPQGQRRAQLRSPR